MSALNRAPAIVPRLNRRSWQARGLVAWYPGTVDVGHVNLRDFSGNGNAAQWSTAHNGPNVDVTGFARAHSTAATDDVPTGTAIVPRLDGAAAATLAIWFRRLASSAFCGFAYGIGTLSRLHVAGWSGARIYVALDSEFNDITNNSLNWQHAVVVFDGALSGANKARLYLDGAFSHNCGGTPTHTNLTVHANNRLRIGYPLNVTPSAAECAWVDARAYARAWSAEEVADYYHRSRWDLWRGPETTFFVPAASTDNAITGNVTHALSPAAGLSVDRVLAGALTHALAPAAALSVDRVLVGALTHALAPAAGLSVDRVLAGALTHALAPAAGLSVDRVLAGEITHDLSPAAALTVDDGITGEVTHALAPAAALSVDRVLAGTLTHTLIPAAALGVERVLAGQVTVSLAVAAAMSAERSLVGAVPHALTPGAALVFDGFAAIVGDVPVVLVPAAALQAVLVHALAGDVAHLATSAAALEFVPAPEAPFVFIDQIAADVAQFFVLGTGPTLAADLVAFMTDFGVTCEHDGSADFVGILDDEHTDDLGIAGRALTLTAPTSALANVAEDDTVTIGGVDYVAKTAQHDGTGVTVLLLAVP